MRSAFFLAKAVFLILAIVGIESCSHPPARLNAAESRICVSQGGYESGGAFGSPFCQYRYSDAGKVCSSKSNCQGQCIVTIEGSLGSEPKPGTSAHGTCEAEHSTFGCYAKVENGKISPEGGVCVD